MNLPDFGRKAGEDVAHDEIEVATPHPRIGVGKRAAARRERMLKPAAPGLDQLAGQSKVRQDGSGNQRIPADHPHRQSPLLYVEQAQDPGFPAHGNSLPGGMLDGGDRPQVRSRLLAFETTARQIGGARIPCPRRSEVDFSRRHHSRVARHHGFRVDGQRVAVGLERARGDPAQHAPRRSDDAAAGPTERKLLVVEAHPPNPLFSAPVTSSRAASMPCGRPRPASETSPT